MGYLTCDSKRCQDNFMKNEKCRIKFSWLFDKKKLLIRSFSIFMKHLIYVPGISKGQKKMIAKTSS